MRQTLAENDTTDAPFADTINRSANLSRCGAYRFTLTRTWSEGERVCFIGLNPSTADHRKDDPTVCRWIRFARAWGYGSFTAVNLYPYRSSSPAECRAWSRWRDNGPDWHVRDVIQENLGVVVDEAKRASAVVACWGARTWDPEWVDHLCEQVQTGEEPWPDLMCLGATADGSPIHPSARGRARVPDSTVLKMWRPANAKAVLR